MLKIPHGDRWHDQRISPYSHEHCCVCGRQVGEPGSTAWLLATRSIADGGEHAISHPREALPWGNEESRPEFFLVPIGPECLRKHKELQFAVVFTPTAPDAGEKGGEDA